MEGIFLMGKIRKTYDRSFKKKAVDMYLKEGMGYKRIAKELDIDHTMVRQWVNIIELKGCRGLKKNVVKQRDLALADLEPGPILK